MTVSQLFFLVSRTLKANTTKSHDCTYVNVRIYNIYDIYEMVYIYHIDSELMIVTFLLVDDDDDDDDDDDNDEDRQE